MKTENGEKSYYQNLGGGNGPGQKCGGGIFKWGSQNARKILGEKPHIWGSKKFLGERPDPLANYGKDKSNAYLLNALTCLNLTST